MNQTLKLDLEEKHLKMSKYWAMHGSALISNQTAGKGLIATLTGILGLYLTAAMWVEFNDALGTLFGPSIGVIIGTLVFLIYQDRKNVKEFTFGQDYTTSESTTLVKVKMEDILK